MPTINIKVFGDWEKTQKIFAGVEGRFQRAVDQATLREAHFLRGKMIENMTSGGTLAGKPFAPLAPTTLVIRKLRGFGGTKPLIVTGTLRNSINVLKLSGGGVFVGIRRGTKPKNGKGPVNLAELHEFGGGPWTRPMTPKQRRFLAVVYKKAGIPFGGGGRVGQPGMITVRIPARPYIGPVIKKFAKPKDLAERFWANVAKGMGYDLGKP